TAAKDGRFLKVEFIPAEDGRK
ncbi:conjugal transfer protein TraW, partial [Salmonella enterica subsp. enterica serovar 4,[5],12:i:-]|nr:conjugal transfer protein TraW [Salmonella enterica subsp. enterica serovar 4,[5],12:i:-]EJH1595585.1 conjugal transfer protein TraW [Salmonella enterica]